MTTQPIEEKMNKFTFDGEGMLAVVRYFATPVQIKYSGVNVGFDVQISENFVQYVPVEITEIRGYNNFVNFNKQIKAIHAQLPSLDTAWSMRFARQSDPENDVTLGLLGYHVEAVSSLIGKDDKVPARLNLWVANKEQRLMVLGSKLEEQAHLALSLKINPEDLDGMVNTGRPIDLPFDSLISVNYANGKIEQSGFGVQRTHQLTERL